MTDARVVEPFAIGSPLPDGVTVLEASAGTGKTYTIAALATLYVAEGLPLDQMLLVSFTRLSTGELRDRVRARLADAHLALEAAASGLGDARGDDLLRLLIDAPPDVLQRRRNHLARAVADFDAATITTTHQFCQEVLRGMGVTGDIDREYHFVEDSRDLIDEVVGDLYVRGFFENDPIFTPQEARAIVKLAIENPSTPIAPVENTATARARLGLALRAREAFDRRKRRAAAITFNDLLTRLRGLLEGSEGIAIAERLRRRYRVVLIDEFQDTDPDQWEIVRRAFGAPGGRLVLIGDPKQAVYAFRGADVYAYLAAVRAATTHRELNTNWRSDQGLIDAYDALFGGTRLGHPEIVYREVRAASANQEPRLRNAPVQAPLRIRLVRRDLSAIRTTPKGYIKLASAREHVLRDLVGEVVSLLRSDAQIECRTADGTPTGPPQRVGPSDLAVLVRTGYQARTIKAALEAAGVPAVVGGAGSVFDTESARHWLRLLEALERPQVASRARSAALTPLIGWSAEEIAGADDSRLELLHRRLHQWSGVLRTQGVAALAETVMLSEGVAARTLSHEDGERDLTDLRHIAELLHAAAVEGRMGTTALTGWMRRRIAGAADDGGIDERTRRMESDAAAVHVLTIHASKGLEFPIVFCPYLWEARGFNNVPAPVDFHDAMHDDDRTIDVGLEGDAYSMHRDGHRIEERGEELRLAYVALTRARHQAVVWWAGTWQGSDSVLSRLVFDRSDDGTINYQGSPPPSDAEAARRFRELADRSPGCVSVEEPEAPIAVRWERPARPDVTLSAARLDRDLDVHWRRNSYSAITAGAHELRVASEIEEAVGADDRAAEGPVSRSVADDAGEHHARVPILMGELPATARFGTFVHRVLELTDVDAPDLDAEIGLHVEEGLRRQRVDIGAPGELIAGLGAALETPLGPLVDDARLRDIAPRDRLTELTFELPLVGGDAPTGELAIDAIARLLEEHLAPGDPLAAYPARLADPSVRRVLRGYLTGTIDVVARLPGTDGRPRFAVIDYKSNRLTEPGATATAWDYRATVLAAEMLRGHYVLQALLYQVALHRYLRWRLPGYDPELDLAGVLYLFLRGMIGAETPVIDEAPTGVFAWRPAPALVVALSDLFDRGAPA
jgi:exodeoxyribonuclease V beta subunit